MLHFDKLDLDAPRLGVLVDDLLELGIELFPLRKELVEVDLPEDAPERGLGKLGGRKEVILDVNDTLEGFYNPEIKDGADFYRDIVPSNNVLRGNLHSDQPEADPDHAVDRGEHQDNPRALGPGQNPAQPENHAPLR
jgi:hypothetical protein